MTGPEGPGRRRMEVAVRDADMYSHVAPCVRNDVLNDEDVILTRPARVIFTEEGITDCISLMDHGFPVVSPRCADPRGRLGPPPAEA